MKEIRQPWLVCRMYFDADGSYQADTMGSIEFAWGPDSVQESQRSIFSKGFETGTAIVVVNIERYASTTDKNERRETKVFMIAGVGFDFKGYQTWLQKMADGEIRTKHGTGFYEQSRRIHGIVKENHLRFFCQTSIWLDTQNDVFWTLTQENNDKLLARLEEVRQKWQKKGVFKKPSEFRK